MERRPSIGTTWSSGCVDILAHGIIVLGRKDGGAVRAGTAVDGALDPKPGIQVSGIVCVINYSSAFDDSGSRECHYVTNVIGRIPFQADVRGRDDLAVIDAEPLA